VDAPDADLLGALPEVTAWVRSARAVGAGGGDDASSPPPPRVLIHCAAGVSRSPAVLAACLLAEGAHRTVAAALAAVAASHPPADPNPGFVSQLALWEASLGGGRSAPAVGQPPAARAWAAARLGEAVAAGEGPGLDLSALLAALPTATAPTAAATAPATTLYRCRACRRLVATGEHAVPLPDPPPAGGARFKGKSGANRKGGGGGCGSGGAALHALPLGSDGSSLFVQPLRWMFEGADPDAPLPLAGKLSCPGCGARLGGFNWAGGQTAGGAWAVPAFQLHLGRLDAVRGGGGGGGGGEGGSVGGVRTPARLL